MAGEAGPSGVQFWPYHLWCSMEGAWQNRRRYHMSRYWHSTINEMSMTKDQRKYPRRPVVLDVELSFPSGETKTVKSRDISEGGLFLVMESRDQPMLGEVIGVRLLGDSASVETLPSAAAIVVHQSNEGMGVAFIVMEFQDDF
jgi:hypothetical protein